MDLNMESREWEGNTKDNLINHILKATLTEF